MLQGSALKSCYSYSRGQEIICCLKFVSVFSKVCTGPIVTRIQSIPFKVYFSKTNFNIIFSFAHGAPKCKTTKLFGQVSLILHAIFELSITHICFTHMGFSVQSAWSFW
jgi:hypothetical protein